MSKQSKRQKAEMRRRAAQAQQARARVNQPSTPSPPIPATNGADGQKPPEVELRTETAPVQEDLLDESGAKLHAEKLRARLATQKVEVGALQSELSRRLRSLEEEERQLAELSKQLLEVHGLQAESGENQARLAREWEKSLEERRQRLDGLEAQLVSAEQRIFGMEEELHTERVARSAARLAEYASLRESLKTKLDEVQSEWEQDHVSRREGLEKELAELRSKAEQEIEAERALLDKERADFAQEVTRVKVAKRKLERRDAAIETEVTEAAFNRVEVAERQAELGERRATELIAILDERDATITALEGAQHRLGDLDSKGIAARIADLEERNRALQDQLSVRLAPEEALRITRLEAENTALRAENQELLTVAGDAKRLAADRRRADQDEEILRRNVQNLEAQKAALAMQCDELREELGRLVQDEREAPVFPTLQELDTTRSVRRADLVRPPALDELVDEIRRRLRHPGDRALRTLDYRPHEVRLFLAGLAMSRLHLLEGPSGTGKTTLPIAIARALGGESRVIEVEAGWRDRLDLYGHYNSFEHRFDEKEFTKAIYEAGCPSCQDQVFIVVLDEMNMSRPEQYFSQILSQLEREQVEQGEGRSMVITLANRKIGEAEPLLLDHGKLTVPPNVWLVGTANDDETTETFAPKTYDRSFVLQLSGPESLDDPGQPRLEEGFSYAGLGQLFDEAVKRHSGESIQAFRIFKDADVLAAVDSVGELPSRRLWRQFERFAAVLIAAGGTSGQAVDHLLATRTLHSTPGRFGLTSDHLDLLEAAVAEAWARHELVGGPESTRAVIELSRRRLDQA